MSVVITSNFVFGPFKRIDTLSDRLDCDGVHLPFNALGSYEISDDDSLAPPPSPPTETGGA